MEKSQQSAFEERDRLLEVIERIAGAERTDLQKALRDALSIRKQHVRPIAEGRSGISQALYIQLMEELNIELAEIRATSAEGKIHKENVISYIADDCTVSSDDPAAMRLLMAAAFLQAKVESLKEITDVQGDFPIETYYDLVAKLWFAYPTYE